MINTTAGMVLITLQLVQIISCSRIWRRLKVMAEEVARAHQQWSMPSTSFNRMEIIPPALEEVEALQHQTWKLRQVLLPNRKIKPTKWVDKLRKRTSMLTLEILEEGKLMIMGSTSMPLAQVMVLTRGTASTAASESSTRPRLPTHSRDTSMTSIAVQIYKTNLGQAAVDFTQVVAPDPPQTT